MSINCFLTQVSWLWVGGRLHWAWCMFFLAAEIRPGNTPTDCTAVFMRGMDREWVVWDPGEPQFLLSHTASTGAWGNSGLTWSAATCPKVLLLISFFIAWMSLRQFFNKAEMDSAWWNLGFFIAELLMRVWKELGYVLCLYLCLGKYTHLLLTCLRELTLCILLLPSLSRCLVGGRESQLAINTVALKCL